MGKACALALSEIGIKTVINDLDELKAQKTVDEFNTLTQPTLFRA
ncbi:MAG: hypothetical protein CL661_09165 [Bacteroidetes bacterium]|jgi:hypothetical protein|nr:hypothetical protein [Bacteroidota bacterium]|tara:strand:- start:129 stop:263 length:135 start_codon:yes stop_codon:yes gene_type:complete